MLYNVYIGNINPYNLFRITKSQLDKVVESISSNKDFTLSGVKYYGTDIHEFRIFTADEEKCTTEKIEYYKENVNFRRLNLSYKSYLPPETLLKLGEEITDEIIGDLQLGTIDDINIQNKISSKKMLDIFISHSSKDIESAKIFISILRSALNLNPNQIRCTSVPGYKLAGGINTDEALRNEIINCKVFIGMLTQNSIKSTYVLFELGARWGNGKCLKPIVCEPNKQKIIKGPLSGIHCFDGTITTDIVQMIQEISNELKIKLSSPDVYLGDITDFVRSLKSTQNQAQKNEEIIQASKEG